MSRKIERVQHRHLCLVESERRASRENCDANRLASLARLTFNRQQAFILPDISAAPAVYGQNPAKSSSLMMAETFVKAGLGSMELWKKSAGDVQAFLSSSLSSWVADRGGVELQKHAEFSLGISTNVDLGNNGALVYIESDASGYCRVGNGLKELEKLKKGLAADFYNVLISAISRWSFAYTYAEAEDMVERWVDCTDFPEADDGETFDQLCERAGISFPDLKSVVPETLRGIGKINIVRSAVRLKKFLASKSSAFRRSELGGAIDGVLKMYSLKCESDMPNPDSEIESFWEDSRPLPGWLIAFEHADAVTQCFDEESNSWLEVSHAPSWYTTLDVSVEKFKIVLSDIEKFIQCNNLLGRISKTFEAMEKRNAMQGAYRRAA